MAVGIGQAFLTWPHRISFLAAECRAVVSGIALRIALTNLLLINSCGMHRKRLRAIKD